MVCTATPPAVYRPRRPREPTLYRLINSHYEDFQRVYAQRYQRRYGYWRPAIGEAVRRFLRRSGCRVCPRTLSRLPSRNLRGLLVPPTMPLPELSSKALADLRRPGGSRNLCPGPPPAICVYHSQATTNLLSFRPPPAGKVDAAGVGDDERGVSCAARQRRCRARYDRRHPEVRHVGPFSPPRPSSPTAFLFVTRQADSFAHPHWTWTKSAGSGRPASFTCYWKQARSTWNWSNRQREGHLPRRKARVPPVPQTGQSRPVRWRAAQLSSL